MISANNPPTPQDRAISSLGPCTNSYVAEGTLNELVELIIILSAWTID